MYKKLVWFCLFFNIVCASTNLEKFYHIDIASHYERRVIQSTSTLGSSHEIMTHHWSSGNNKLMVMAHGYIDNCGYVKPLQVWFLNNGYDVLCIELPGHGLSSGERADIEDFKIYGDVYLAVFNDLPTGYETYNFYAHSTGAVGMMDILLDEKEHPFKKIIFAAPLVRSHLWELSNFGMRYFGFLLKRLPTRRLSLKDESYRELLDLDPTLIKSTPKNWFKQLVKWNKRIEASKRKSNEEIVAIFAGEDTVIDQEYNEMFYRRSFDNIKVYNLPKSDHAFHYESDFNKTLFYTYLSASL